MSRSILVPLDYTGCAYEVVEVAVEYAARLGLGAVLYNAVTLPSGVTWTTPVGETAHPPTAASVLIEDAQTALKGFATEFERRGVPVQIETPRVEPVDGILERAADDDIELIVMGTHGRRGLERMVMGSVAERVLRRTPRPVLVVRTADPVLHPGVTDRLAAVIAEGDG